MHGRVHHVPVLSGADNINYDGFYCGDLGGVPMFLRGIGYLGCVSYGSITRKLVL